MQEQSRGWSFWIDRGGTFTDVIGRRPDGRLVTAKMLSEAPERYRDAAVAGMARLLEGEPEPRVDTVKMGTTVATNALLTRRGERTVLVTNRGLGDVLAIGTQHRPRLFDLHIVKPAPLYELAIEVAGRVRADGVEVEPLDIAEAERMLRAAWAHGVRACAIALMHGARFPGHEQKLGEAARRVGFAQVSLSSEVSALQKLVGRGETAVVDAYLSPTLRKYVAQVTEALEEKFSDEAGAQARRGSSIGRGRPAALLRGDGGEGNGQQGDDPRGDPADQRVVSPQLLFMQSNGGLVDASRFRGKDSVLSGPAGGIVGAASTCALAGITRVISFDMGGTSTDVAHYDGEYERVGENMVAGVRLCVPMLSIHTVAAGGGSIVSFDGGRYRVGPESAGASPGPMAYRRGGPLTVTDCNVMLGRVQPAFFPKIFGERGDQALDREAVVRAFEALALTSARELGDARDAVQVAEGFLEIAVQHMAHAINKISIQRGHDVSEYTLCAFGGAGGQHACQVAEALGMRRVVIHPLAGVLSAYGIGVAELREIGEVPWERGLVEGEQQAACSAVEALGERVMAAMVAQGVPEERVETRALARVRYAGSDTALDVEFEEVAAMRAAFVAQHRRRFGFDSGDGAMVLTQLSVEAVGRMEALSAAPMVEVRAGALSAVASCRLVQRGQWVDAPVYQREWLQPGDEIAGPALIAEANATTVVDTGWTARVNELGYLLLECEQSTGRAVRVSQAPDPVLLEVFNQRFMAIAEEMGVTLANTARSVNIKERLDFSCALFDADGQLVANAPHVPVHLGSMGETVAAVRRANVQTMRPGDVFAVNAPTRGGTHLPDITVVTPVYGAEVGCADEGLLFFVASRAHHADIGGVTPGSMPPMSTSLSEEGVAFGNLRLVRAGVFDEAGVRQVFLAGAHPARAVDDNVADLKAQVAANAQGVASLRGMIAELGLPVVRAYMGHVLDNAEAAVREVIGALQDGAFETVMDEGATVRVAIAVDRAARTAVIDFAGTSAERRSNVNAPRAITTAAVLYVFRALVAKDIPLNAGCLRPLQIRIPEGSMLSPSDSAAVVAGNVETSQVIVNTLLGALGVLAGSAGTMNNFTFGNARYQYYETIAGGAGAGATFDGADAVQTHMTNSRLTDPEVLERRFPVWVNRFAIRRGSGGKGAHRGGCGVVREIGFLEAMTVGILSNNRNQGAFGLQGGAAGAPGENAVVRSDGTRDVFPATAMFEVGPGDVVSISTPGGGGFG